MPLSLYQASVPLLQRGLDNLSRNLAAATAHAASGGASEADLLATRFAPDMFALPRQVQSASDAAKACAARLSGQPAPSFPDTETTFPELQARIARTLEFLATITPADIDDRESETITLATRGQSVAFAAADYLRQFALPNFFFHLVTTYDLLRHKGVPLGKRDFLGPFAGAD